ncbi:hypothetical protein WJX84_003086 [Apatococcus fuscideae]|uniref:Uncharacterized protein n=1 Tax=Apatococcus fuscideae TaxID=2026836 RepID=A0AAW1SV34_9CHLO
MLQQSLAGWILRQGFYTSQARGCIVEAGNWKCFSSAAAPAGQPADQPIDHNAKGIQSQRARQALRPEKSDRNRFDANSKKMRQMRKDAKERKQNEARNAAERDRKRIERWQAGAQMARNEPAVIPHAAAVPN